MLLSLHLVAISTLIFVVGGIAFRLGKEEGIRITKDYYEEEVVKKDPPASGR